MRYGMMITACSCVLAGSLYWTGVIVAEGSADRGTVGEDAGAGADVAGTVGEDAGAGADVSGTAGEDAGEKTGGSSENAAGNSADAAFPAGGYLRAGIQGFFERGDVFVCESLGSYGLSEEDLKLFEVTDVLPEESEYADLAIADVTNYVNVRAEPNTDSEILGKIYDGAVAHVLASAGEENDWFQIVSGNVEGYIKAEYFLYGEAAAAVIDDYVTRYAVVQADRLNVREHPGTESARIGYIDNGERVKLIAEEPPEQEGWLKVSYTEGSTGYVAAEYVTIAEEFVYAKTLEEEARELAEKKALEARRQVSEKQAAENTSISVQPPNTSFADSGELRNEIVDYAMQYLGNRYVHGGQTLAGGTDCSGFTSLIYAEFGYSLSRTPAGQLSGAGQGIDYSQIQPGDIICYGSSGKCTHVALYIGDGKIIHAANSRKGVVTGDAGYDTILGVRNVIDYSDGH